MTRVRDLLFSGTDPYRSAVPVFAIDQITAATQSLGLDERALRAAVGVSLLELGEITDAHRVSLAFVSTVASTVQMSIADVLNNKSHAEIDARVLPTDMHMLDAVLTESGPLFADEIAVISAVKEWEKTTFGAVLRFRAHPDVLFALGLLNEPLAEIAAGPPSSPLTTNPQHSSSAPDQPPLGMLANSCPGAPAPSRVGGVEHDLGRGSATALGSEADCLALLPDQAEQHLAAEADTHAEE